MTDHIFNLAGSCDKSPFPERFTASKYGPLIWGQGAVNEDPEGNTAISGEDLILKVGFATEVGLQRHGTAPGVAVQLPCLYLLLLRWMKECEIGRVAWGELIGRHLRESVGQKRRGLLGS